MPEVSTGAGQLIKVPTKGFFGFILLIFVPLSVVAFGYTIERVQRLEVSNTMLVAEMRRMSTQAITDRAVQTERDSNQKIRDERLLDGLQKNMQADREIHEKLNDIYQGLLIADPVPKKR